MSFADIRSIRTRLRVAVIGGGVAGLCAAYELSKLGYCTTVLEASPRVGGRIFTHRFSSREYGELGAMRIPEVHSAVTHYVEHFGLHTRLFRSSLTPKTALATHSLYRDVLVDAWKDIDITNLLTLCAKRLEPPFTEYERLSLKQFLSRRMTDRQYKRLLAQEHMNAYEESAFLETVLGFLNYRDGTMYEVVGGLSLLIDCFANSIAAHPQCGVVPGMTVDSLVLTDTAVKVGGLEQQFDFVICAVPPSALASIRFQPGLPIHTLTAMRCHYIPASKTVGLFDKAFWRPSIKGGVKYLDSDAESLWYPSSDLRVLTLQYSRGEAAIRFSDLSSSQKEAHLLDKLRKLHPGVPFELQGIVHHSWHSPQTGGGGFCRLKPGQFLHQCATIPWAPIPSEHPRLFFAGEAYSLTHGWIQGAIESGLHAVNEIVRHSLIVE